MNFKSEKAIIFHKIYIHITELFVNDPSILYNVNDPPMEMNVNSPIIINKLSNTSKKFF